MWLQIFLNICPDFSECRFSNFSFILGKIFYCAQKFSRANVVIIYLQRAFSRLVSAFALKWTAMIPYNWQFLTVKLLMQTHSFWLIRQKFGDFNAISWKPFYKSFSPAAKSFFAFLMRSTVSDLQTYAYITKFLVEYQYFAFFSDTINFLCGK